MLPGRLRGDAGAATTEMVIVAPVLIFTILLIVQAGLYFHAVSVASAAAQDGARAASIENAAGEPSLAEGRQTAQALLDDLAPDLLLGEGVNAQAVGAERVRVTVTGDVVAVAKFPGFNVNLSVNERSEAVVERFRPDA
ncbi:MAG TPA: TadE family protein [Acidimicrobiales bacterium]|nr:TadE family protein [Acidimicrobiales bacterium]